MLSALVALALPTGACSSFQEVIGSSKKTAPDEFLVTTRRQPLAIPPDFDLRPPQPGAPALHERQSAQEARRAVFGDAAATAAATQSATPGFERISEGEFVLLQQAGAVGVDPNIRYIVERETGQQVASSQSIVDDILFWRPKAVPEKLVDANAEAKRLRENAAAGKAPADGEIPTIKRKKAGILDGIFN